MAIAAVAMFVSAGPGFASEASDKGAVRAFGEVTSVAGTTFKLKTRRRGEIKVQHDSKTKWYGGSASDLKVGSKVGVAGNTTGNVLHAEKIGFGKDSGRKRLRKHLIRGEITSAGDHSFSLKTRGGEITVKYNLDTKFRNGTP